MNMRAALKASIGAIIILAFVAGGTLPANAAVSTAKTVTVPNFVGMTVKQATKAAKTAHLKVKAADASTSKRIIVLKSGWTVTKQAKKAGSKAETGQTIKLSALKTKEIKKAASAAAPAPVSPYGAYPEQQAAFVSTVETAATAVLAASTDLQSSELIRGRDSALCSAIGGSHVENWVGTVHGIGANGDGYAYVEVEIAPTIVVQTWNNAFSDIGDETLIHPESPFFATLVPMEEGTKITFSGDFVAGDSCVKKANLSQAFYGTDPNFVFRFSSIVAQ